MKPITELNDELQKVCKKLQINAKISYYYGEEIHPFAGIEILTRKPNIFDGMQIILFDNMFEVSEYSAGKNHDELHIFTETSSMLIAIKSYLKGNKKRTIIKKW